MTAHPDIRIGTLVPCTRSEPVAYARRCAELGFESLQLFFWGSLGDHELPRLAEDLHTALAGSDTVISSLGIFGNPLHPESDGDGIRHAWQQAVEHAPAFGCDLVCGFTGRVPGSSIPDSIDPFRTFFAPLVDTAGERNVRLAFENCTMNGSWQAGNWNIAHNPDAWELMFAAVPELNVGLEWEPCHQLTQLIDPLPQIHEWRERLFHVHGKDATVRRDLIARHGIVGKQPWVWHRHPGFGDSDWIQIISELRRIGYSGAIDIEGWHDPVYREDLEMTGQVASLRHLQRCRGGEWVPPM